MAKKQENGLAEVSQNLWKDPNISNWEKFAKRLKGNATYYNVVFEEGKIKTNQDITKSFVEIRDAKRKLLCKVPLFTRNGKALRGATIYLKGLQVINGA